MDELRNFLFGKPSQGGMDLAAINIARGRERGLADYNTIRSDFGLERLTNFSQISSDIIMNQTLEFVYGDINKIDPWVGLLAENHMSDALFGKTAMTILKKQFVALRNGDRYYYLNDDALSPLDKLSLKNTRLADIVRRNSPVTILKDNIFLVQTITSISKDIRADSFIDFALYPNPVHQMLFLRIPSDIQRKAILQVVDMQGKLIMEREANLSGGNNTLTLSLPFSCTPGTYAMIIRSGNLTGQKLFIKVD
ncbi:MAG TPA: peroxidase family protein [Saprospiraceae bacterium]|nr:peroxidase family protein [Saprospiraceae bacterium]